ncbi:uncharacterized protein METZ01_LOCUS47783 [marine metagenome]|uniref:LppX_LprAFG lipoprotein n=1 Tax=marine metagenome TaxID=408172 RepID=A0A381RV23_9ZZZZ
MAALVVVGVISACSSTTPTEPPDRLPEIESTMRQAVDQLLALKSAAFSLEHLEGATVLLPGVLMTKVSGVISVPGRFKVTVEAESEFPKSYLEIGVITIEDAAYMTDIFTGRWNKISAEALPFNLSGLGQTLAGIVESVQQPRAIRTERLNGIDTMLIKGQIVSEGLSELVPGSAEGFPVELELWLERDGLLRQVLIVGQVVATDDPDTVRKLTLDNINQPVEIEPPGNVSG